MDFACRHHDFEDILRYITNWKEVFLLEKQEVYLFQVINGALW